MGSIFLDPPIVNIHMVKNLTNFPVPDELSSDEEGGGEEGSEQGSQEGTRRGASRRARIQRKMSVLLRGRLHGCNKGQPS